MSDLSSMKISQHHLINRTVRPLVSCSSYVLVALGSLHGNL